MKHLNKALVGCSILVAVFGISFYFFYKRAQNNLPLILRPSVINQSLPKANLVNISGGQLDDERLRRGKVILVFTLTTCKPCDDENEFLKTLVGSRKDVGFYYVIPFGKKDQVLREAESKYAFETFFDEGSMLSRSLQIYQVPLKVFLEDGVIKKTWLEATVDKERQAEFKDWLNDL